MNFDKFSCLVNQRILRINCNNIKLPCCYSYPSLHCFLEFSLLSTVELTSPDLFTCFSSKRFYSADPNKYLEKFDNLTCLNLDSHANIHVFKNPALLENIRPAPKPIRVRGVGGIVTYKLIGDHKIFGEVIFDKNNEFNILSQTLAREKGYLVTISSDNNTIYLINKNYNNHTLIFKLDVRDGFYKCDTATKPRLTSSNNDVSFQATSTLFNNSLQSMAYPFQLYDTPHVPPMEQFFSKEQRDRALTAVELHNAWSHPSDKAMKAMLESPSMINVGITYADLKNARVLFGPCTHCREGKPYPHRGTHTGYDPSRNVSYPGELLHVDIVFINGKAYLFAVDDLTGFMMLIYTGSKTTKDLEDAYNVLINAYAGYGKIVKYISSDHENNLRACETYLNSKGVQLQLRIPGEHEKVAERGMRVVRERMRTKLNELPYKLCPKFYKYLALHTVTSLNYIPNTKTTPRMPEEILKGVKINFLTDFGIPFGHAVLCPCVTEEASTVNKNDIGISMGPSRNTKGSTLVLIPDKDEPLSRRSVQPMLMTPQIIKWMNQLHDSYNKRTDTIDDLLFKFNDTIVYSERDITREGDVDRNPSPPPVDHYNLPVNPIVSPSHPPSPVSTITNRIEPLSISTSDTSSEATPTLPAELPVTVSNVNIPTNISITPDPHGHIIPVLPAPSPVKVSPVIPLPKRVKPPPAPIIPRVSTRSTKGIAPEKYQGHINNVVYSSDLSAKTTPFPVGYLCRGSAFQMSLVKALKSDRHTQAEEAAEQELTKLTKLKSWIYLYSLKDASPSVHHNLTPSSMFLKDKLDGDGNFLLYKARLVNGGHRTDPNQYDPFEKNAPTVPIEVVNMQLGQAVKERLKIETFDLPTAYLHAELQEGRYHKMKLDKELARICCKVDPQARKYLQPDGTLYVEVRRALYGLPESAKLWNEFLNNVLKKAGYTQCPSEPCLFRRVRDKHSISLISVFVDDCLHTYSGDKIRD